MTISSTTNRVSYSGNDVTTEFAFAHPYRASTDFTVIQRVTATGVETVKALSTDYTISGVANSDTGGFDSMTLTMLVAPPTGTTLHIIRKVPPTSSYDPTAGAADTAPSREGSADRAALAIQGVKDITRRALLQPETAANLDLVLPEPSAATAGNYLIVNPAGDGYVLAASAIAEETTVSVFAETLLDDTSAGAMLTTLGFSAFFKTLIDDAAAVNLFTTLGFLSGSATVDFPSTGSGRSLAGDVTITVTGAVPGDIVFLTSTTILAAGGHMDGVVSSANTVTPYYLNLTGGTVNPGGMTVLAFVIPKSLFGL